MPDYQKVYDGDPTRLCTISFPFLALTITCKASGLLACIETLPIVGFLYSGFSRYCGECVIRMLMSKREPTFCHSLHQYSLPYSACVRVLEHSMPDNRSGCTAVTLKWWSIYAKKRMLHSKESIYLMAVSKSQYVCDGLNVCFPGKVEIY